MSKKMNWEALKELVSELNVVEQVRLADLKGIEVPDAVRQEAAAQAEAAKAAEENRKLFTFATTDGQPDRRYLKVNGFKIGKRADGKDAYAKGLFLETRAMEQAHRVLTLAIAEAKRQGIPTAPAA